MGRHAGRRIEAFPPLPLHRMPQGHQGSQKSFLPCGRVRAEMAGGPFAVLLGAVHLQRAILRDQGGELLSVQQEDSLLRRQSHACPLQLGHEVCVRDTRSSTERAPYVPVPSTWPCRQVRAFPPLPGAQHGGMDGWDCRLLQLGPDRQQLWPAPRGWGRALDGGGVREARGGLPPGDRQEDAAGRGRAASLPLDGDASHGARPR
mmetsp:Transcript_13403/g.30866  ORF Transcript_13403/g.30866 Transcript_13403/m.30866 type:complete len:204 (+) Transcript_13403:486-1097(+)